MTTDAGHASTSAVSEMTAEELRRRVSTMLETDWYIAARIRDEGLDPARVLAETDGLVAQQSRTLAAAQRALLRAEADAAVYLETQVPGLANVFVAFSVGFLVAGTAAVVLVLAKSFDRLVDVPIRHVVAVTITALVGTVASGVIAARRVAWLRAERGVHTALEDRARLEVELDEQLRSLVVLPAIDAATKPTFVSPATDEVDVREAQGLSSRIDAARRVETAAYRRILVNIQREGGATVGLSGIRGAGKSELLRAFCDTNAGVEAGGRVGVVVPAPVAYEPQAFLRLVVRRLAESVPGFEDAATGTPLRVALDRGRFLFAGCVAAIVAGFYLLDTLTSRRVGRGLVIGGLIVPVVYVYWRFLRGFSQTPIGLRLLGERDGADDSALRRRRVAVARTAVDLVRRLRFLEVQTLSSQGQIGLGKLGLSLTSGVTLNQLPLSDADLADELGQLVGSLRSAGYDVVIGIDELDKLESSEAAERFLNSIKVLFPIRGCSFLVTISENAWASFARRGLAIRDVFDSSLDTVVVVEHLTFKEARRLVRSRDEGMTDTTVALCFALSGGLPREFLRVCRQVGEINVERGGGRTLDVVTDDLLDRELKLRVDGVVLGLRGRPPIGKPTKGGTPEQPSAFIAQLELLADVGKREALDRLLLAFLDADSPFAELAGGAHPDLDAWPAAPDDWIREARRQLFAYAYFGETVRRLFVDAWPSGGDDVITVDTLQDLAHARRRLETDAGAGWRATSAVREQLHLPLLPLPPSPPPAA